MSKGSTKFVNKIKKRPPQQYGGRLICLIINQMKGIGGGGKSKPEADAVGIIYIVVGTGKVNESGGPSNQILRSTSVIVVGAMTVVPATVAIGNGGRGIRLPSTEAVGLVVPGKAGNTVEGKGEKKGLRNGEAKNGDERVNGENGNGFTPETGDQTGLKNGAVRTCAWAPTFPIKRRQRLPEMRKKRIILDILYILLNLFTTIPPLNL